jgi:hypothetical protein
MIKGCFVSMIEFLKKHLLDKEFSLDYFNCQEFDFMLFWEIF